MTVIMIMVRYKNLFKIKSKIILMSYYSFIENTELKTDKKDVQLNKKDKFIIKEDPSKDVPGHYKMEEQKCKLIDDETHLLTPGIQTKDRVQIVLKDEITPNDYNIQYEDGLRKFKTQKTGFYYNNRDVGPGRGFGNLNLSSEIRDGEQSRTDTKEFREKQESQQLFDYQYQYLDKNFQDPKYIVMPIPRGGVQTRKQNQLTVNTMRTFQTKDQYEEPETSKTIKFNY